MKNRYIDFISAEYGEIRLHSSFERALLTYLELLDEDIAFYTIGILESMPLASLMLLGHRMMKYASH